MPDSYDFVTLMCRLKAAQNEVEDFKSGEKCTDENPAPKGDPEL